jgi:hypothetical protein
MTRTAAIFELVPDHPLRSAFLRWQCRIRQIAMREQMGRPSDGMMPVLTLQGQAQPVRRVITIMSKRSAYSVVPELRQMAKGLIDPAQRREKAVQFLSASYYQKHDQFSDVLTATFPPDSDTATEITSSHRCALTFSAFNQVFSLDCRTRSLSPGTPLFEATWWHNVLFNPNLHRKAHVIAFEPDWDTSSAAPPIPNLSD